MNTYGDYPSDIRKYLREYPLADFYDAILLLFMTPSAKWNGKIGTPTVLIILIVGGLSTEILFVEENVAYRVDNKCIRSSFCR